VGTPPVGERVDATGVTLAYNGTLVARGADEPLLLLLDAAQLRLGITTNYSGE
jgi:hypothetical protein